MSVKISYNKDCGLLSIIEISLFTGCKKEASSYMWIYVLLGNMLRGIGETPIAPLGISYLDDFAKDDDAPLYIGNLKIDLKV